MSLWLQFFRMLEDIVRVVIAVATTPYSKKARRSRKTKP
jgi:hypothetical protein